MKTLFGLASLVLALLPQVTAHYRWVSLINGGVTTTAFQYVRQSTNWNSPVTDVTSNDLRCNVGATTASTANVTAGSTVGFALDQAIFHPGVLNVYMSKAPSTAASYDGSGKWFKIYQISAVTNGGTSITWPTDNLATVTFKIPASTPNGQYLLRIEHIALHSASSSGGAQFYIACAQINLTGGGNGSPSPLVSIPGVYAATDPGILINIYWPIPTSYQQPGPTVWTG
ncbi:hypothetical protein FRC20_003958 [Serendipita sp. 405]|nr:hypothetical protein FRC18_002922 [Serendipita sp. 400]KAG8843457.1 hypothetical protein FRC20_003958 [Serendipita sp. 405]